MGVITENFEISSSVPADRFFKGYILDSDNLLPKVLPVFKSIETIEGDGGVGCVKKFVFNLGEKEHYVKHRTDVIDETNRVFQFTVIEGGDLGDEFESITNTVKIESGADGGSIFKNTSAYHPKSDDHNKIQETIKRAKEGSKAFFHAIEAHLQAHPHEYA